MLLGIDPTSEQQVTRTKDRRPRQDRLRYPDSYSWEGSDDDDGGETEDGSGEDWDRDRIRDAGWEEQAELWPGDDDRPSAVLGKSRMLAARRGPTRKGSGSGSAASASTSATAIAVAAEKPRRRRRGLLAQTIHEESSESDSF